MKTQPIIGEGICGMQVSLNVLDQHEATKMVNAYDKYNAQKKVHDEWYNNHFNEELRIKVDPETGDKTENWKKYAWNDYRKVYPEPEVNEFSHEKTLATVITFLRKLCSKSDERATIFEPEDE